MAINSNVNEFLQRIRQGVKPNMFVVNFEFPGTWPSDGIRNSGLRTIPCVQGLGIGRLQEALKGIWEGKHYLMFAIVLAASFFSVSI